MPYEAHERLRPHMGVNLTGKLRDLGLRPSSEQRNSTVLSMCGERFDSDRDSRGFIDCSGAKYGFWIAVS